MGAAILCEREAGDLRDCRALKFVVEELLLCSVGPIVVVGRLCLLERKPQASLRSNRRRLELEICATNDYPSS